MMLLKRYLVVSTKILHFLAKCAIILTTILVGFKKSKLYILEHGSNLTELYWYSVFNHPWTMHDLNEYGSVSHYISICIHQWFSAMSLFLVEFVHDLHELKSMSPYLVIVEHLLAKTLMYKGLSANISSNINNIAILYILHVDLEKGESSEIIWDSLWMIKCTLTTCHILCTLLWSTRQTWLKRFIQCRFLIDFLFLLLSEFELNGRCIFMQIMKSALTNLPFGRWAIFLDGEDGGK